MRNVHKMFIFQSTPPCAGGDLLQYLVRLGIPISIHAPLRGGRQAVARIYWE